MPVTINGNGSIAGLSVGGLGDGGIVDTGSIANGAVTNVKHGAGSVIQVVEGTVGSRIEISSGTGSWHDTNLHATITPTSSSSKVFVIVNTTISTGNNSSCTATVFRGGTGGTNIGHSTYGLFHGNASGSTSAGAVMGCNMMKLDSPSTTSATQYLVKLMRQWAGSGGNTLLPSSNNLEVSTITLMEISV